MRPDDSLTRFDLAPYFHGKVLELSEGTVKAFPHFIWYQDVRVEEPHLLGALSDGSMDAVVSSNLLNHLPGDEMVRALQEWSRVVRDDGHIVLHLPATGPSRTDVVMAMETIARPWDMVECRSIESGRLIAFRFTTGKYRWFSGDALKPAKTCAIIRLGAFGDCIQTSSILPWLKAQGYHITWYVSDHGHPVVKHDPNVDRFIIQGRNEMPPAALGAFWEHERKKYDRWINLSESVEGSLLPLPGSAAFEWPASVRAKYLDRNYLEFTHEIAEVPPPYQPKFHSTYDEREWARFQKRKMGRRNILWSLSGSSPHKTWPHLDEAMKGILGTYENVHIVLVGDETCQVLEAGWARPDGVPPNPRVHCRSGKWTIRQSMAFAEVADLIIGTETGLLNAAGSMETPKIVTLSHSSENMLCKHWKNYTALSQPQGFGCPKQPCRQLHADRSDCPFHEDENMAAALCQWHITPQRMFEAVAEVLEKEAGFLAGSYPIGTGAARVSETPMESIA